MSETEFGKRAKQRELLRRRQAADSGSAPAEQGGAGIGGNRPARGALLRMVFENRARNNAGSTAQSTSSEDIGNGAGLGNRGRLLRRLNSEPLKRRVDQVDAREVQLLSELSTRVEQLAEEVERLRSRWRS